MSVNHQHQQEMQHQQHVQHQHQLQEHQQHLQHAITGGTIVDANMNAVVVEAGIVEVHQNMEVAGGSSTITVTNSSNGDDASTSLANIELQGMQTQLVNGVQVSGLRMWTNPLTYQLLEKVQKRKALLLDPKLRRRTVYAEVAQEFQEEGVHFTTSDIEKKYTSLLSTYRRNMDRKRGSTWQYYSILEDIYSEVGPDGRRVLLPTSSLHPNPLPPPSPQLKTELRQSKRMRTRPARLKGLVDYSSDGGAASSRYDTDLYSTETFDRVRELMTERLEELQTQRDAAFLDSRQAWTEVREGLELMNDNIQTLNSSVVMLAHTVTNVLSGINKMKK